MLRATQFIIWAIAYGTTNVEASAVLTLDKVWKIPDKYELAGTMHLPYIPFSEPVAVFSDKTADGGSQKVTHYGGTTTIINSVHGHSYTIFPEMDEMVCHNTTSCVDESHEYTQCKKKGARPHGVLQHLFPENLALFKATGATKFIRRCRF
mmetsp:Transcript_17428/g.28511  ORF Transcript_17428/g.28511 Transcript_17428/m.28511 type:complete len:151 (-) Transcript_17428:200-652(-)